MNPNYILTYSLFAIITIIICLIVIVRISSFVKFKEEKEIHNYYGIIIAGMFAGCGILFFELFPTTSSTLNSLQMQKVDLISGNVLKILFSYLGIILGALIISFFLSLLLFKFLQSQTKNNISNIMGQLLFITIFWVILIAAKSIVIDLFHFFQPTVNTPFFK